MTKKSRQTFKYLQNEVLRWNKKKLRWNEKGDYEGLSDAKNCLRPKSAPLNRFSNNCIKLYWPTPEKTTLKKPRLIKVKGWLHCLTSMSKRRFLVDNTLMFGSAWFLVMVQIQFSLIKKDWTFRTHVNPSPPTSSNISFLSYPPPPWTSYVYHTFVGAISFPTVKYIERLPAIIL